MEQKKRGLQAIHLWRLLSVTLALLLVPLLAMAFEWRVPDPGSDAPGQVNWGVLDFVIMGALISGTGVVFELLKQRVDSTAKRWMLFIPLMGILFLIWAELAVGILNTPFAGS